MKQKILRKGLLIMFLCFLFPISVSAAVDKLNISQIIQQGNDVYLYVNMLDDAGKPAADMVTPDQISCMVNKGKALPVMEASVFGTANQGVSYVFCVDVSKSVTDEEMQEIRNSISDFIKRMSPNDYAKIITIGSEVTSVCDSTQDQNALEAAVQQIDRIADYTYLYKGISVALDGQKKRID